MPNETVYWEDVTEGMEIPPFVRKTGLMEWNRFAAANEEHFEYHMDHVAGKAMGFPNAIGMGNLRFAYLHNLLEDGAGEQGRVEVVGCQYRGMNEEHDTLTCWGQVVRKFVENGEHLVELHIGVRNQKGEETAPGRGVVVLPSRG